jgi:hypothetical protein
MKSKNKIKPSGDPSLINRREALRKAGYYALSTATLMVLMRSQAKAQVSGPPATPDGYDPTFD